MNVVFDHQQLLQLLTSLYVLTGIRANIFDRNGRDICLISEHAPFCERINACPEGHGRCVQCDAQAVLSRSKMSGFHFYRCHAGICEAVLPIQVGGSPIAYLAFGQFLDDSPMELQWQDTVRLLDWYPAPPEQLRAEFDQFRRYSKAEIDAYIEIVEALAAYIQLKGMILSTEQTELQKLELYLDQHYMEKLSLESISADLHIGRTKLCALAKTLSNGRTLSQLITERRINAAKRLLLQNDLPIASVADAVGISDYNYFSKVFRASTGMTPSAFRKRNRHNN